jgi:hypothetical protein
MYVFVNGLMCCDVLDLLSESTVKHYESLKQDQNLKAERAHEERKRKNLKRNSKQREGVVDVEGDLS